MNEPQLGKFQIDNYQNGDIDKPYRYNRNSTEPRPDAKDKPENKYNMTRGVYKCAKCGGTEFEDLQCLRCWEFKGLRK